MRRIFGSSGPKTPKPTLQEANAKVDTRVAGFSFCFFFYFFIDFFVLIVLNKLIIEIK